MVAGVVLERGMQLVLGEWAELVAHEDKMPFCLLAAASQQVTVP